MDQSSALTGRDEFEAVAAVEETGHAGAVQAEDVSADGTVNGCRNELFLGVGFRVVEPVRGRWP